MRKEVRMRVGVTVNGERRDADVEPRLLLVHLLREVFRLTGHAHRVRHDPLRRLHGAPRRPAGEVVHGVRGPGGRADRHDRRGPRAGRAASSAPGRLRAGARAPVRLLHAGHADDELRVPPASPAPERGRDPARDLREPVPLHGLRQYRQGHPARGDPAGRRRPKGGHDGARARSAHVARGRRHGPLDQAQGGSALHSGPGDVRRRRPAPRHALPRHRAEPVRAREDRQDRHRQGAGDSRRPRGHHRPGPREVQPPLDADAHVGHADGAAGGEGDVPGAGGRGGPGDGAVHRGRRRRRGRGPVRAAPRGRRSEEGPRARRARPPHRQEGQARQPHLALGVGRPGRHRSRVPRGGRHRQGEHLSPADSRRLYRDVRLRRPVRQGLREADGLDDDAGPARDPDGLRARGGARRARGAQDPDHLARHRRGLRREGAGLPRLRDRGRRVGPHREAGEVDRGPDGESPGGLVRARLSHHRRARRDEGGEAHRPPHQDHRRPRLRRRGGESRRSSRPGCSTSAPAPTT